MRQAARVGTREIRVDKEKEHKNKTAQQLLPSPAGRLTYWRLSASKTPRSSQSMRLRGFVFFLSLANTRIAGKKSKEAHSQLGLLRVAPQALDLHACRKDTRSQHDRKVRVDGETTGQQASKTGEDRNVEIPATRLSSKQSCACVDCNAWQSRA